MGLKIPKLPGQTFIATLQFQHKGPAQDIDIGVGLAPGQLAGHLDVVEFSYLRGSVGNDSDWETYNNITIIGVIPSNRPDVFLWDVLVWVQDAGGPRDPGGNGYQDAEWYEDVYEIAQAAEFASITADYS